MQTKKIPSPAMDSLILFFSFTVPAGTQVLSWAEFLISAFSFLWYNTWTFQDKC